MFLALLLFAFFASGFSVAKEALMHGSLFFLLGSRMLLAGGLFLAFAAFKRQLHLPSKKSLWTLFLLAFFNIYITNVCEYWALSYLSASKTCFLYSLSPFISALLSFILFKERLNRKKWLGLFIGSIGLIPLILSQTASELSAGAFFFLSLPELSMLLAVITSCYGWILLRKLVGKEGMSPLVANGFSMLFGGVMTLIHSLCIDSWNPLPVTNWLPFTICFFFLLIVSNAICYNLAGVILQRFSATFFSFAGLTTPIFTALFSFLLHNEVTSAPFWLAYAIVLGGLSIFYLEEIGRKKVLKTVS